MVMNADQIVPEKGKIVEMGSHSHWLNKEETHFELVRNQLQLGN
jgi:ABC-type multidrug transport system fused ATPase/permease subunit